MSVAECTELRLLPAVIRVPALLMRYGVRQMCVSKDLYSSISLKDLFEQGEQPSCLFRQHLRLRILLSGSASKED